MARLRAPAWVIATVMASPEEQDVTIRGRGRKRWKICLSKWNFSVGAQWTVAEEALLSPRSLWRPLNRKSSCLCSVIRLAPGRSGKPYVNSLCRCPLGDNRHLPKLFPHQGRYVILQRCLADRDPPKEYQTRSRGLS